MSANSIRGTALTFTWPQSLRLKTQGIQLQFENEETLPLRTLGACQTICNHPGSFERVPQSTIWRVHACLDAGGGHFEKLLWIVTL